MEHVRNAIICTSKLFLGGLFQHGDILSVPVDRIPFAFIRCILKWRFAHVNLRNTLSPIELYKNFKVSFLKPDIDIDLNTGILFQLNQLIKIISSPFVVIHRQFSHTKIIVSN